MAGAQFKQNPREVVKLHCWEMTELLRYSESLLIPNRCSYRWRDSHNLLSCTALPNRLSCPWIAEVRVRSISTRKSLPHRNRPFYWKAVNPREECPAIPSWEVAQVQSCLLKRRYREYRRRTRSHFCVKLLSLPVLNAVRTYRRFSAEPSGISAMISPAVSRPCRPSR